MKLALVRVWWLVRHAIALPLVLMAVAFISLSLLISGEDAWPE